MIRVAPSLLAADLADLAGALSICEAGGADLVHLDVMDGTFVPNLTFGMPVVAALRRRTRLPLDVHLMIERPERHVDAFLDAGADRLAIHWEASVHLDRTLARIRARGAAAGIALNPAVPVELLADVLPAADFVLLMSVNPGFSGQTFLPYVAAKARRLHEMAEQRGVSLSIAMDGGLDPTTIPIAVAHGVDTVVAGAAVFAQADPVAALRALRALANGE